jgi:ElaB/YqjD/DUF883 family membrane-anchored ribosome-binding protein
MIVEASSNAATRRSARDNDGSFQGALRGTFDQAKASLWETESAIRDKAAQATAATEKYVGDNPWKSLVIAGSIGLLLGLLFRR